MAASVKGQIPRGVKILQPGRRFQVDDVGIGSLQESYACNIEDIFSLMPAINSRHSQYPNLVVKNAQPEELTMGRGMIHVQYAGLAFGESQAGGGSLPDPVYSLQRAESREPITTHPNWARIVQEVGQANVMKDEDGLFKGFGENAPLEYRGVTEFLVFGVVWSKRYVSRMMPSLAADGKIDRPDGNPPRVPLGHNWLKMGTQAELEGYVYRVQESWLLSGPNGWNRIMYG